MPLRYAPQRVGMPLDSGDLLPPVAIHFGVVLLEARDRCVGDSTMSEITYASEHGVPIRYLSPSDRER